MVTIIRATRHFYREFLKRTYFQKKRDESLRHRRVPRRIVSLSSREGRPGGWGDESELWRDGFPLRAVWMITCRIVAVRTYVLSPLCLSQIFPLMIDEMVIYEIPTLLVRHLCFPRRAGKCGVRYQD
jgi:hypothetical protein